MSQPRQPERAADLVLAGFVVTVLVFATPLRGLWSKDVTLWWLPFAVWGAILGVAGLCTLIWIRHGD